MRPLPSDDASMTDISNKIHLHFVLLVSIWNSVRMPLVSTVIILLVSYPMAYMLSRCSRRVASNLIILMMIPYFTNSRIRLYSYLTLFNTRGILTGILAKLGMTWSADFLYSESAVVLGLVYVCIPYAVLPIYSSIERLDIRTCLLRMKIRWNTPVIWSWDRFSSPTAGGSRRYVRQRMVQYPPFVMTLAYGGSDIYKGWMKNKKSAMVSCNDGFRPVSFYIEALEEEASDWF